MEVFYKRHRYLLPLLTFVFAVAFLLAPCATAQETTASIQGVVKDQSGAVVPKATVEVSGPSLIGTKKAETDAAGAYRIANLPPGEYSVTVTAQGFRPVKRSNIALEVGRSPSIDLQLQIGSASEVVEVTGEAPIVDVTSSKVATSVTEQILEAIPKGRSFQSVITFAPGARQEPLQSSRDDSSRANGFQIDGASDSENVYLVEGLNTTNIQDGGVGKNVPFEFVQEVQIKSSSFEAEFGGALGGVVNVIQKKGSNAWHGSAVSYFRNSALNANDQCGLTPVPNSRSGQQIACGLRANPDTAINNASRSDAAAEYYVQKKDPRRITEPGFEVGGPVLKDRLWLFSSYVPTFDRWERQVNFTGANAGVHNFTRSYDQHNALVRLDYLALQSLRLFGSWQYGYGRVTGLLPGTPDSAYGQVNTNAGTDPATISSKVGQVQPSSVWNFGGDWTPTSKLVVTSRFGYFFNNTADRGKPSGIRYNYLATLNAASMGLDGNAIDQTYAHKNGFETISDNQAFLYDAYKRKSFSSDASYYVGKLFGTHNFKGGYAFNRLGNEVSRSYNTALVQLFYGQDYSVATNQNACDAIIAANQAQYGVTSATKTCRGNAGYFIVSDGVDTIGNVRSDNHSMYMQDGWTVGHGLTLNLGVRFDKEFLPPYSKGANSVSFGFTDKIAPRIGGAYDLFQNGKVKLYASYGKFFDIMKYSLPRGSFGGEYWHDCVYAMDNPNFNLITPSAPVISVSGASAPHGCPPAGPAPGVNVGRFIENVDFRKNITNPDDPGIDPHIKPMQQHEYVVGSDFALSNKLGLEVRYSRKRLDQTIEDIGITDDLGFYIGNPGSAFGDLLHRTVSGLPGPQCPSCPKQPKAIRNYDGLEIRLTKQPSSKWYGSVSYTYSRLYGNYSGLADTDITDASGGRHSPNNHRSFDQPQLQFDAHGNIIDGPLSTDRPHALKLFGWYQMKWFGQYTTFGFAQSAYSGTPLSTCWPVLGTSSSCVFVEGRGNWVNLHRDPANGNIVSDGIEHGRRTGAFTQTDFNFKHEVKVSKTHENYRLGFEWNVSNLFNQRSVLAVNPTPIAGTNATVTPKDPSVPETGVDWNSLLNGWDYIGVSNAQSKVFFNRYGKPNLFQASRTMRLAVRFTF